jgi:hypothetical protein
MHNANRSHVVDACSLAQGSPSGTTTGHCPDFSAHSKGTAHSRRSLQALPSPRPAVHRDERRSQCSPRWHCFRWPSHGASPSPNAIGPQFVRPDWVSHWAPGELGHPCVDGACVPRGTASAFVIPTYDSQIDLQRIVGEPLPPEGGPSIAFSGTQTGCTVAMGRTPDGGLQVAHLHAQTSYLGRPAPGEQGTYAMAGLIRSSGAFCGRWAGRSGVRPPAPQTASADGRIPEY